MKKPFLDTLKLKIIGGHGGNGMPKYGGIGGQGGAVVFKATDEITLKQLWKDNPSKQVNFQFSFKFQTKNNKFID